MRECSLPKVYISTWCPIHNYKAVVISGIARSQALGGPSVFNYIMIMLI